jgi:hypothetical protein
LGNREFISKKLFEKLNLKAKVRNRTRIITDFGGLGGFFCFIRANPLNLRSSASYFLLLKQFLREKYKKTKIETCGV